MNMNIGEFLSTSAKRLPGHLAIRFGAEQVTFDALNRRVDALARGLGKAGLRPGEVCVLMMPNSVNWVVAYYALAKLGAVVLPVNFLFRTGELGHIFRDSRARAFIGHSDYLEQPAKVLAELPALDLRVGDGQAVEGFMPLKSLFYGEDPFPMYLTAEDDTSAIIYTSGTTGLPKGAQLTHRNLISNARTLAKVRTSQPHDVVLGVLPFYHIYGLTSVLNVSMCLGLTIRLWAHFETEEVFRAIEEEESTILIAVPTIFNRLVEQAQKHPPRRSSLRFCISGGASLPVEILRRFETLFNATIVEGYGLTETSPVCIENPFAGLKKPGSIGLAIEGFEVRIVDEQDLDLPPGEVGELIVRGPGVMKGYLNQPEATEQALRGGWLHTGDLARQDEDGYIYIVDRKKDLIIRGGYNVYPREVEEILYRHPAVAEAAVIGIPHADLGEEVAAVVVLRPGAKATPEEIRAFVKEQVAPYKYPRQVIFAEELPKTSTGKILKRHLLPSKVS
ncbi:MAG: long-chain fatty acid--CoA ligase [Thermodesulfobacteriota bacterium]|nr:long-chain fatty acid--CoA ligase [Thermodesulfobacteriota bacterium]